MEILEIFFDVLGDLSDSSAKRAWKKHPLMMIFEILLFLGLFILSIFCTYFVTKLLYLPFHKYGEILFLGREDSILTILICAVTFITLLLVFALIAIGIILLVYKCRGKSFIVQENSEPMTKKQKLGLFGTLIGFILVSSAIFYCYTYNTVVFTETQIISTAYYNPTGVNYSYSEIKSVEIDNENDANLHLTFYFDNNKKLDFAYEGDSYSDIEKYKDNDLVFISDLVTKLRDDNVQISYKCTYEDVAGYCGEEHHSYLKNIFDK